VFEPVTVPPTGEIPDTGSDEETGPAPGLGFRRRKRSNAAARMARAATLPTTPPTMAPNGVEFSPFSGGVGVEVAEVVLGVFDVAGVVLVVFDVVVLVGVS
jgi:hypothetical protein